MRLPVPFDGLSNRRVPRVVGLGKSYDMLNATVERGAAESRAGFLERWRRPNTPTAISASDLAYGMGYGRYGNSEVFVHFIKPNGRSTVHVYVQDVVTGLTRHDGASTRWTARSASDWSCVQFGKYIYAVNETDGVWRLNIEDTTSNAWEQADVKLSSLVVATSGVSLKTPDLTPRDWSGFTLFFSSGSVPYLEPGAPRVPAAISINASNQLEIQYTGGGDGYGFTRYWFGGTFSTGQDWSKIRYLFANLSTERTTDPKPWEDPKIWPGKNALYGQFKFYWSNNAAATPGAPWTGWYEGKVSFYGAVGAQYDGSFYQGDIVIDLDFGITGASVPINSVRRWFLGVPLDVSNNGYVWLSQLALGGTFLGRETTSDIVSASGVPATTKAVEYAVTFFNTGTSAESAATFQTLAASATAGIPKTGLPPVGATALVSLPNPGVGFNRTRLYRRRRSDGDKWYLIREASAAETFEDNRVDWINDPLSWAQISIQPSNYGFGTGVRADLRPQCVAVWKTHMALGVGPEVYLSEAQNPVDYAQPLRNTEAAGEVDTTASETSPRTLYVSNDQSETVLQLVATDHLYAGTTRGVYVMIGDSAQGATPFRRLPMARPPLNEGAMTSYGNGVLCATKDGLFYYDASRSIATDNDTQTEEWEDLTIDIPESYKWLLSGPAAPTIVGFAEGEIWVIRGTYFLKRTKTGRWEKGAYSSDGLGRIASGGIGSDESGVVDVDTPVFEDDPGSGVGPGGGGGGGGGDITPVVDLPGNVSISYRSYAQVKPGADPLVKDEDLAAVRTCNVTSTSTQEDGDCSGGMFFTLTATSGTLSGRTVSYNMTGELTCTINYDLPEGISPGGGGGGGGGLGSGDLGVISGTYGGGFHNSYTVSTTVGPTSMTQVYTFEYSSSLEPLSGTTYGSYGLSLDATLQQVAGLGASYITGYSVQFKPTALTVSVS